MQNLFIEMESLLKNSPEFFSQDGSLLRNLVIEKGLKLDPDLLDLLLSHERIKGHFFTKVGDVLVFDKEKFLQFVNNKEFLPDSYTAFKNKIGLSDDGGKTLISQKQDVSLVWPYKDCIVKGGQTKESVKREEIFWNTTLAPDDISRLIEPKVQTNWKRFSSHGSDQLMELNHSEHLIIKGNNLLVLHSLLPKFRGRIKLIYADPPYNTGGATDTFAYNNNFKHSTWLSFMKNRIEVAKDLLSEDGFLAVTIDHNELFYLGTLLDELLGRDNRVGIVTIYINPKGRQHERFFSAATEYMLVYAKNVEKAQFRKVTIDEEKSKTFNLQDDKGNYRLQDFIRVRTSTLRKHKPDFWYPIYISQDLEDITLDEKPNYYKVLPLKNGKEYSWKTIPSTFEKSNKEKYFVAVIEDGEISIKHKYYEQQVLKNLWTDKKYFPEFQGTNLLKDIIGDNDFSYPKSLYAVKDTIKIMTSDNDIILDFFAGSGTTGHAVLELNNEDGGNRKFILCEQLDYIHDITIKRIQNVLGEKDKRSFVYFELLKLNEHFVSNIECASDKDALMKTWQIMQKKAHFSYRVDIKSINEHAEEFEDLSIKDQKKFLLEILDKNTLYVNYSEIDDIEYGVSEEDKRLNHLFYGREV